MPTKNPQKDRQSAAVGYLRRSTEQQEQSIPDQRSAIDRYATDHGIQVIRYYIDDAITGTQTKGRKAFQDMMKAAQSLSRDFSFIIVYDIKRFGRVDNDEAGHYRYLLRTNGIEVCYVNEFFTGHSTDDLVRAVKQWQAREESRDLSRVTIRGLLSKVASTQARGCWMGGVPPYGYDLRYEKPSGAFMYVVRYMPNRSKQLFDESRQLIRVLERDESPALSKQDRCRLVLSCQDRVEVIREIYRLYLEEGRCGASIARRLNRLAIPTPRDGSWSSRHGGGWSCTAVNSILRNPAYAGDLAWNRRTHGKINRIVNGTAVEREDTLLRKCRYNSELDWIVVRDTHPQIVSRHVWERANFLLLNIRTRPCKKSDDIIEQCRAVMRPHGFRWAGPQTRFLFSRLAKCAQCGSSYQGLVVPISNKAQQRAATGRQYQYVCRGYLRHGRKKCRKGTIPQIPLEESVIAAVIDYYKQFTGPNGHDRSLAAIKNTIQIEQAFVGEIIKQLHGRLDEPDHESLNYEHSYPVTAVPRSRIFNPIHESDPRYQALLKRRILSLGHIPLTEDEIPEILPKLQEFTITLEDRIRSNESETRLSVIRSCISLIMIDADSGKAHVNIRALPSILGVLDAGPKACTTLLLR